MGLILLIAVIVLIVFALAAIVYLLSTLAKAQDEGLSEKVKQNADGTKVRLSGEKIDVDLTKGTTKYENGTELPILTGFLTNFTPDRIVTNITYQVTFKNGFTVAFPLNSANTKINVPPWQTIQYEYRLSYDQKLALKDSSPNVYSSQVIYNEVDIYKQHAQQLLNQIRSNSTN